MSTFGQFCDLVRCRIGIELPRQSRASLDTFLASRVETRGYPSVDAYLEVLLATDASDPEFQELVGTVTNGKTAFFRHREQLFDIRDLMADLWRKSGRVPNIWSAGCATGEEVYSLAMMLMQDGVEPEILGTDVNAGGLQMAKRGEYGKWKLQDVDQRLQSRFFKEQNGHVTVLPELRNRVRFMQHNLVDARYPMPPSEAQQAAKSTGSGMDTPGRSVLWDVILCRNVFIYFRRDTVVRILERMARALSPGGHLFVGPTESMHGLHPRFALVKQGSSFGYRLLRPGEKVQKVIRPVPAAVPVEPPTAAVVKAVADRASYSPPRVVEERGPTTDPNLLTIRPDSPMQRGLEAYRSGERLTAVKLLRGHVMRSPDELAGRITLGSALLGVEDYDGAEEQYGAALDLDPLSAEAHFFLGMLYRKSGHLERAVEALRHTLFLDGSFWLASFYLAGLYLKVGQRHKASQQYANALHALDGAGRQLCLKSYLHEMDDVLRYRHDVRAVCEAKLVELGEQKPRTPA